MDIVIPELSLVLLVGASGSGKSTFARRHFRPSEVVSSDAMRAAVCDDESNQHASRDAFELLHHHVEARLAWRRFTVVDATNLRADGRAPLLRLARQFHYLLAAVVFDLPAELCQWNNARRPERVTPPAAVVAHAALVPDVIAALGREGVRRTFVLRTPEEVESAVVRRTPMAFDRRHLRGPFDIVGDVHGCIDELLSLLSALGYRVTDQPGENGLLTTVAEPPPGRTLVFVGDLGDRGPDSAAVYRLVVGMAAAGHALCVLGNHDNKLMRRLRGGDVSASPELARTVAQIEAHPPAFRAAVLDYLESLPDHLVLDGGRLVVAHGGLPEELQGRASGRVRSFALFGDTDGEKDEYGLPVRRDWAADYHGRALVAYGHTPVSAPIWAHNAVNLDTGCAFGGALSALRYPERETVSVPAARRYAEPRRPFLPAVGGG